MAIGQTNEITKERWDEYHRYSFYIAEELNSGQFNKLSDIAGRGVSTSEIFLEIPPQSISISTPFASTMIATNRGVIEEHNGVVFRSITIQGTTGIYPKRQTQEVANSFASTLTLQSAYLPAATSALTSFMKSAQRTLGQTEPLTSSEIELEETGYYKFWLLNNFFVEYTEAKKKKTNKNLRLVFRSPKDNLDYLCSVTSFDLKRDASSPLLYRYSIGLKSFGVIKDTTIGADLGLNEEIPHKDNVLSIRSVLNKIKQARNTIQGASDILRGVQSDFNDITQVVNQSVLALKDVVGVTATMADYLPIIVSNAELLYNSNKAQWNQVLQDFGKTGELWKDMLTFDQAGDSSGVNPYSGVSSDPTHVKSESDQEKKNPADQSTNPQARAASGSSEQVTGSSGTSTSTQSGQSPELEQKSNSSNKAAADAIKAAVSDPDYSDSISLDAVTYPPAVQRQVDEFKRKSQQLTSSGIREIAKKVSEMSDNLAYASGLMDDTYIEAYGLPKSKESTQNATENDILLLAELETASDALLSTLASGDIFEDRPTDPFQAANESISPTDQIPTPTSAYVVTFNRGMTLEQLALSTLGDAGRAREIALLNGLRAPYVDDEGFSLPIELPSGRTFLVSDRSQIAIGQIIRLRAAGVAESRRKILAIEDISNSTYKVTVDGSSDLERFSAPKIATLWSRLPGTIGAGDSVLIPSQQTPDQPLDSRSTPLTDRLTFAEKVFRVDAALNDGGDLKINASGDIDRCFGYENAVQALRIKAETERGELPWHPAFGLDAAVGDTLGGNSVIELIETRLRACVTSDPRFLDADVFVKRQGTALYVRLEAKGKQGTGRIPVEFRINF